MANEQLTPAPAEATASKERREIPSFSRQDALQARLANPGENYAFINPANHEVPALTVEAINPKATDSLIQHRSDEERRETAKGTVDAWKQTMVTKFADKNTLRFFQESEKGKRFAGVFRDSLGIDVTNLTAENVTKLYNDFCATEEGKNGAIAYADKLLESYSNKSLKELEDNLDAFTWMGNILGEKTAQVLAQRISLVKRSENDEEKNTFITAAGNENRINKPTDPEVVLLDFLYKGGKDLPVRTSATPQPTSPVATVTPTAETNNPPAVTTPPTGDIPQAETPAAVTNPDVRNTENETIVFREDPVNNEVRFAGLTEPANLDNPRIHERYAVENPPTTEQLGTLSTDEIEAIVPQNERPLYLHENNMFRINPDVVPHVIDLEGNGNEHDARFTEATALTNGESYLLSLAAASAPDPASQSRLYTDYANILVQTYDQNPDLFEKWLAAQGDPNQPDTSMRVITHGDLQRVILGRPRDYILFPHGTDGQYHREEQPSIWRERISELREAVRRNEFTEYHDRWLEVLSHGIDIQAMVQLLRAKQPSSPTINS